MYFDFAKLERFGRYDPSECVFNHGMFVLDTDQWLNANVTQKIETWMKRFKDSGGSLYKYGTGRHHSSTWFETRAPRIVFWTVATMGTTAH